MTGALIVGAGQAGAQAALSLRELGYAEPITIVGSEPHLPYQRPPLSKAYLMGDMRTESLYLRKASVWERMGIAVRTATRVVDVQMSGLPEDCSGTATFHDDTRVRFDRLMLAVGGRPRMLTVPNAQLDGMHYLRSIDDATHLVRAFHAAENVVVVGGGFIGLEAAAVARQLGKTVTVLETADRLLPRAVAPEVSAFMKSAHERRGVTIELGSTVREIAGDRGHVTGVVTDRSTVTADIVIVGVGMAPRASLADRLGLATIQGAIAVDEFARTSDPRIVAAGDCTIGPNPMDDAHTVRLESVQNAIDQAKTAAATMVGAPTPYRAVPWFWSNQSDLKLQMAGLINGYDEVIVRGSIAEEKFSVFYFRRGELLALHAINRPQDFMFARKSLAQASRIERTGLADTTVQLSHVQ